MTVEHICTSHGYDHPLPPEDPAKLQGPEVGEYMIYRSRYSEPHDVVVRVVHRSYVWSPGECSAKGGYRHYDWSVIEEGPGEYRAVVVNDSDLSPLPPKHKPVTVYALREMY